MKFAIIATAIIAAVIGQGYPPPWFQFNPYFNGQIPNAKNSTFYNAILAKNNSYGVGNPWGGFMPFPWHSVAGGRFTRALAGPPPPFQQGCIVDKPKCNGTHSVYMGCLSTWDKPLLHMDFAKAGLWYKKRKTIIQYPQNFTSAAYARNETITAIWIEDKECNGTGGYATIYDGGVGFSWVKIRLFSISTGKGFQFLVRMFGR